MFVTPSNHRVHHAKNPEYIDKNFGATTLLWDKMFNTYQAEEAEVVYGVVEDTPRDSVREVLAGGYPELFDDMRAAEKGSALAVAMAGPGGAHREHRLA